MTTPFTVISITHERPGAKPLTRTYEIVGAMWESAFFLSRLRDAGIQFIAEMEKDGD